MDDKKTDCPNCQKLAIKLFEGSVLLLEMEEECLRMEQGRILTKATIEGVANVFADLTPAQIEAIHPKATAMISNLRMILGAMNSKPPVQAQEPVPAPSNPGAN